MPVRTLDQLVLAVAECDATIAFSRRVGMVAATFEDGPELGEAGIAVELGPVDRTGAERPLRSLYVCDPDGNLVELSEPAWVATSSLKRRPRAS